MIKRIGLTMLALLLALYAYGTWCAQAEPIVRRATITFPSWPAAEPGLRVALLSDIHMSRPDMSTARLARIVAQVNGLRPDLVLITGDYMSTKALALTNYTPAEALVPLAGLRARFGVFTVYGNHDHWVKTADIRAALQANGVHILVNAMAKAGPLTIGGLDDLVTGHARPRPLFAAMAGEAGPKLLFSHSPDIFPEVPDDMTLTLAGHTHCGQIALPGIGPLMTGSIYGKRYVCGLVREGGRTLVVTGGLGTSILPLRMGAPPDLWFLTLGPAGR